jgi:hypothetical protein
MSGFVSYIADLLLYFIFAGVTLHLVDRFLGVPVYRWWYNDSREKPLEKEYGFLYGHPGGFTGRLHKTAYWISGIQSLTFLYKGKVDIWTEIPAFFLEAWFMVLGFHIGAYVYGYMRGEQDLAKKLHTMHPRNLLNSLRGYFADYASKNRPEQPPIVVTPAEQSTPSAIEKEPPMQTPEDIIAKFTRGRNRA